MSLIVGDDGQLEVGEPDDPTRQANARRVADYAYRLEMDLQTFESHDLQLAALAARIDRLEGVVEMLERLITG